MSGSAPRMVGAPDHGGTLWCKTVVFGGVLSIGVELARRWIARAAVALALAVQLAPCATAQNAARYAAGDRFAARVVGVDDGDSVTLLVNGREQVRARLADIDAPEWDQPHGDRSTRMLSDLAFGRDAEVSVLDVDAYERAVVRVRVGQEEVNAAMVRQGGAWVFTRYNRNPALPAVEAEARAARRGLWSMPEGDRVAPWEWRAAKREERERRRAAEARR